MPDVPLDLPQGTLDLLILRSLASGEQHGWAISQRIQQVSSDVLQVPQGSLYPALHRLERRGWVKSSWRLSDHNRRARFYRLTRAGARQLDVGRTKWRKLVSAVGDVLQEGEA
jgi:transcriptional regulator